MAEVVQSLFGVTPQSYQRAQQQQIDAQALRYAQLDPFQQATYGITRGANMLGGAVAGAFGVQDPELQRITMRQQIAGQLNPNDLSTFQQAMAALAPTDPEGARMVQAELEKTQLAQARLASENALVTQRTAEKMTPEQRNAMALAERVGPPGSPEFNTEYAAQLQRLTTKEAKGPAFGADREAVAGELFENKTFAELSPTQKAVVNKRVSEEGSSRAALSGVKLTNVLPGQKELVDIPGFRLKVQSTIAPQSAAVFAADNALTAIEDSIKTGNFVSFNAARVQLAKSLGDSQLSRRDVEQAGGDPSLLGKLSDVTSTLFTGTPTIDTQKKIESTLRAIKKVSADKANREIEQQRKIALRSPGYNPEAVAEALTFREFQAPTAASPAAVPGDLAAQAAAELARRKGTK